MFRKLWMGLLAAIMGISFSAQAYATTYTFSTVIDLSTVDLSSGDAFYYLSNVPSFNLVKGDTITGTVTFANNQALQFGPGGPLHNGYSYVNLVFKTAPTGYNFSHTPESVSVNLLGVNGELLQPNPFTSSDLTGNSAVTAVDYGFFTHSQVSITGFEYSTTLTGDSTFYNTVLYPTFIPTYFEAFGQLSLTQAAASPVPEPATLTLLGSGLLGFQEIRRRRRT